MIRIPPRITLKGDKVRARDFIGAAQSQLRILENSMSFQKLKQGIRKIRLNSRTIVEVRVCFNLSEVLIHCLPVVIGKEEKKELKKFPKFYVYVTISNYVTIWDLLTGEVAEGICNNEGEIYDSAGNPLITFPCHEDELVTWLEGIKDRPTRQIPEIEDNHKDIGNENRVERLNVFDPSYEYYFGVAPIVCWLEQEYSEWNTCGIPPYSSFPCKYGYGDKWTIPDEESRHGCSSEACDDCFFREIWENYLPGGGIYYHRDYNIKYFDPFLTLSKKLFLCSYPAPIYGTEDLEYTIPDCTSYDKPIIMKSSVVVYECTSGCNTEWPTTIRYARGKIASFFTVLGSLIIDYSKAKMEEIDIPSQVMALEGDCDSLFELAEGSCAQVYEWEGRTVLAGNCPVSHSTKDECWCRDKNRGIDETGSESNRFGVSWCGSPDPTVENGWYRILLRFYMGQFHETSCEKLSLDVCSDMWHCSDPSCSGPTPVGERFSSVQATIELEKPKSFSKDINIAKYERPEDYDSDPDGTEFCITKKYSELCAFPGREQGFFEEDGKCFPFDGTYVLHTLGEVVEELINNHYVDGSDDQLLVYYLERPNMIEQKI